MSLRVHSYAVIDCHITYVVHTEDLAERIVNINDYFTFSLYSNVCRSLFEKHKLLFSFLVCVRILMNENKINMVRMSCVCVCVCACVRVCVCVCVCVHVCMYSIYFVNRNNMYIHTYIYIHTYRACIILHMIMFVLKGEWHFLISGGATVPKKLPNPASDWLSDRAWGEVLMLAALVRRE